MLQIESLSTAQCLASINELVALLREAVDEGSSVGFLPPLSDKEAHLHWHRVMERLPTSQTVLLAANEEGHLSGCIQLDLEEQPDARHRAVVCMLLVSRSRRRQGVGRALMRAVEREARTRGRFLLTTQTRAGSAAEALCKQLHYQRLGSIPDFVRGLDDSFAECVFYFRDLRF